MPSLLAVRYTVCRTINHEDIMKIKTILKRAAKCITKADSQAILGLWMDQWRKQRPLAHLDVYNEEGYLEAEGQPSAQFELNRVISDDYITMIRPVIRQGEVYVYVRTQRMLDGMGMSSKSWETLENMDDTIEPSEGQTVAQLAATARDLAIAHHRQLIESVGVPLAVARETAEKCW